MTSYRFLLLRSTLGRAGRAIAYYWVSMRAQLRMWRSSYALAMAGYRARRTVAATFAMLRRAPRKLLAGLSMVAWFFGELPKYFARVLEDRREDRADLRNERRLMAAQRREQAGVRKAETSARRSEKAELRAHRKAELAEIKASRGERPHALPVPAWISRMERPERPARAQSVRSIPVPRRALIAGALTLAAVVPAYAIVTTAVDTDSPSLAADPNGVGLPGAPAVVDPAAPTVPGTPTTGGTTVTPGTPGAAPAVPGDTGAFVAGLPALPTPVPVVPSPRVNPAAPGVTMDGIPLIGADGKKLSVHQQRELRRLAKYQAKAEQPFTKNQGK